MTDIISAESRLRAGRRAGTVGIITNAALFALKITVGILSSSMSIIADALNNLSDAGSSVFVLVGYVMSGRPADKDHPYGHARMEYLCGLFISMIVTVLGVEMLISSVKELASGGGEAEYSAAMVVLMAVAVAVKLAMAVFYNAYGKRINSQALRASAVDSIGDVAATSAVVAGMLLTPITGPLTDSILGCAIAVYIIVLGVKLVKESSDTLIGRAPDAEFVNTIIEKLHSYDGVLGIHDLMIHSYGAGRCFASVHLEMDASEDILKCHDAIDNIEEDFRREMNINLVVHLDPVNTSDERTLHLQAQVEHIVSSVSAEHSTPVSMHDFRVVFGPTHSNILFDIAVADDMPIGEMELCGIISERIKKLDPSYNTVITVDKDYTTTRFGKRI
jgi:cation diffusion facilitator family transporter